MPTVKLPTIKKKYASSLPKTNSMYNWHPAWMDSTNYKKMNLRKLFLPLCSVALCLQSYAQDKSFLKDMLWYIDNPSVFEKGQEEGHAWHMPEKSMLTEWDMEVFLVRYTGRDTCTLFNPESRISNGATSKFPQTGKCKVMVTSCSEMYLLPSGESTTCSQRV